jgi:hypothetical protein
MQSGTEDALLVIPFTSVRVRLRAAAALIACCLLVACGRTATLPSLAPDEIETTLFLIGDAGEPDPRHIGAPLDSLYAQASQAPGRTIILYLGDNVYPAGIPEEGAAEYADARRRLASQVNAVPRGARGIFVPGNHDWAHSEPFGLHAIRLQERIITELADGRDVKLLPSDGCPGPVSVDAGRLRLVLLDTQWWLHSYIVEDEASDCPTNIHTATAALREQVRTEPGRVVVVAAHHPLLTGGKHGGYCGITGPFHRFAGSSQDILSSKNRQMRDSLASAFAVQPPLIYAAGHDHNQQVLRAAPAATYQLVSGAGSQSKVACAVRMRESYWVSQYRTGFMRIDVMRRSGVLLRVWDFDGSGRGGVAYTKWLEPAQ